MFKLRHWLGAMIALALLISPFAATTAYAETPDPVAGMVQVIFKEGSKPRCQSVTINGKSGLTASVAEGEDVTIVVVPKPNCQFNFAVDVSYSTSPFGVSHEDDGSGKITYVQSSKGTVIEVTLDETVTITLDANGRTKGHIWPENNQWTQRKGSEFFHEVDELNVSYVISAPVGCRYAGVEVTTGGSSTVYPSGGKTPFVANEDATV